MKSDDGEGVMASGGGRWGVALCFCLVQRGEHQSQYVTFISARLAVATSLVQRAGHS